MADNTWADMIREIGQRAREARDVVNESVASKSAFGADLRCELVRRLSEIDDKCADLFERLSRRPADVWLSGRCPSLEEYYLLAAQGAAQADNKTAGLSPYTDFDVARFFFYEDEHRYCFINPGLPPREPRKIGLRLGVLPEELRFDALRPEQREFFEKYLPRVAARFLRTRLEPSTDRD